MEKWTFKNLIKNLILIYSNRDSLFSKKRIESSVAFIVAQGGMIWWFVEHNVAMTTTDLFVWSGIEFAIAGYVISQIQKEKGTATKATSEDEVLNS